jgi:hypothetical protein
MAIFLSQSWNNHKENPMRGKILLFWVGVLVYAGLALPTVAQHVTVALSPVSSPIQIPDSGGTFDYILTLTNQDSTPISFDVWIYLTQGGAASGRVQGPLTMMLGAGQVNSFYHTQVIPANLPYGYYLFQVVVGIYPDTVWDRGTFNFDKLPASGGSAWMASYNGPGNNYDEAIVVKVDPSGNVYMTGTSYGSYNGEDITTVKYNSAGEQLWVARYVGGPLNDRPSDMALDSFNNVYVTGYAYLSGYQPDYVTMKYDSNGHQLWVVTYNGPGNLSDQSKAVAVDAQGNVYVTGGSSGLGTSDDFATIKYDPNGRWVWTARYNGPANGTDYAYDLALDGAGNVLVTGYCSSAGVRDFATIKYDTNGNQLWLSLYDGPTHHADEALAMALDDYGNAYVTGTSINGDLWPHYTDYCTVKYDTAGCWLWVRTFNGSAWHNDRPSDLVLDEAGNVYVTGVTKEINFTVNDDITTLKYSPDGLPEWIAQYDGGSHAADQAAAIAFQAGYVYVTGTRNYLTQGADYVTIQYDASGQQRWVRTYDGPQHLSDYAADIAVDNVGNVFITGQSFVNGLDYATIKYPAVSMGDWDQSVTPTLLETSLPQECRLEAPSPNPFNATTDIGYQMPDARNINLRVYDTAGRLVTTLVNGWREAGTHEVTFDGSMLVSGMYFVRMQAGEFTAVQKLVLLK